jgi:hypothetical protein
MTLLNRGTFHHHAHSIFCFLAEEIMRSLSV